jgi:hypothetical protein
MPVSQRSGSMTTCEGAQEVPKHAKYCEAYRLRSFAFRDDTRDRILNDDRVLKDPNAAGSTPALRLRRHFATLMLRQSGKSHLKSITRRPCSRLLSGAPNDLLHRPSL